MTTYTYKKYKLGDKTYKFKEPLKIQVTNFVRSDGLTMSELYIPSIMDGYSKDEIKNPEKEIKWYLTYIFENYLDKKDEDLSEEDRSFKQKFMNLIDLTR